jgi:hypothetical protein
LSETKKPAQSYPSETFSKASGDDSLSSIVIQKPTKSFKKKPSAEVPRKQKRRYTVIFSIHNL